MLQFPSFLFTPYPTQGSDRARLIGGLTIARAPVPNFIAHTMGRGTPEPTDAADGRCTTHLTQNLVDQALQELSANGAVCLRLILQRRTGLNLEPFRAQIRQMAEQAMLALTVGLSLPKLSEDDIVKLRNPYVGNWEPCCSLVVEPVLPVEPRTRGNMLSTELHDLNTTGVMSCMPCELFFGFDDAQVLLDGWHDSLSKNTCSTPSEHGDLFPTDV